MRSALGFAQGLLPIVQNGLPVAYNFLAQHVGQILRDERVQKIFIGGLTGLMGYLYNTYSSEVPQLKKDIDDYKFFTDRLKVKLPQHFKELNVSDRVDAEIRIEQVVDTFDNMKQDANDLKTGIKQLFEVVDDKCNEIMNQAKDTVKTSMEGALLPPSLSSKNLLAVSAHFTSIIDNVYNCHDEKVKCENTKNHCAQSVQSLRDEASRYHNQTNKAQDKTQSCLVELSEAHAHCQGVEKQHGKEIAQLERDKTQISKQCGDKIANLEKEKGQLEREKKDISDQCSQKLLDCAKDENGLASDKVIAETNLKHCETQKTKAEDALSKCQNKGVFW
jgi:uncharacterized phage infection (PIP) family protein YhgE